MLIGLIGKAGAGKDTVANHWVATRGFVIVRFAEALKQLVAREFDWPREKLDSLTFKETPDPRWNGVTPRQALIAIGTHGFRSCDPDFWVKKTVKGIRSIRELWKLSGNPDVNIVVTDVRFPNEVVAIQKLGGVTMRIEKIGAPAATLMANDLTETALDSYVPDRIVSAYHGEITNLLALADEALRSL